MMNGRIASSKNKKFSNCLDSLDDAVEIDDYPFKNSCEFSNIKIFGYCNGLFAVKTRPRSKEITLRGTHQLGNTEYYPSAAVMIMVPMNASMGLVMTLLVMTTSWLRIYNPETTSLLELVFMFIV